MALTALDRALLKRCLNHEPEGWKAFVDRFLGLIYHVIRHTSNLYDTPLISEDTEDVAAEIFLEFVQNDYAVLRQFRGHSSLATYLTVIARRICMRVLNQRAREVMPSRIPGSSPILGARQKSLPASGGLESLEEVEKLLRKLPAPERHVVRLFYLEGRSYEEISRQLHIPVNSIGPMLYRSRQRLRKGGNTRQTPANPG